MLSKYLENIKPSTFAIVLVALLIGDALYEYVVFAPTTHDMYRVGKLLLSFGQCRLGAAPPYRYKP